MKYTQADIDILLRRYKNTSAAIAGGGWMVCTEDHVVQISKDGEVKFTSNEVFFAVHGKRIGF